MNSLYKYDNLLKRFNTFELSYETVSHKKVSTNDSIAVAIPLGRKYFLWFTYKEGCCHDACYILGLDKDKQICSVEESAVRIPDKMSLGTVVYCTLYQPEGEKAPVYIAEDIYKYCGIPLHNISFGGRIGFLKQFIQQYNSVALSVMWLAEKGKELTHVIPTNLEKIMAYSAHHIQYREVGQVTPYINVAIPKKGAIGVPSLPLKSSADVARKLYATANLKPMPVFDYSKPAFKYPAVFNVMSDAELDLYHIYAYGGQGITVYCGLAGIQSYKTSVFMNRIFRRIRENENLDLAEESEDESDFENMDANKFVNVDRVVAIECVFSTRHKKWMPVKTASNGAPVIHIDKLRSISDAKQKKYDLTPENFVRGSLRSISDAKQKKYDLTPENFVSRSLTRQNNNNNRYNRK